MITTSRLEILQNLKIISQSISQIVSARLKSTQPRPATSLNLVSTCSNDFDLPFPPDILPNLLSAGLADDLAQRLAQVYNRKAQELRDICLKALSEGTRRMAEIPDCGSLPLCEQIERLHKAHLANYERRLAQLRDDSIQSVSQWLSTNVPEQPHDDELGVEYSSEDDNEKVQPDARATTLFKELWKRGVRTPNRAEKIRLSKETGLTYYQVQVWFQNHRIRDKSTPRKQDSEQATAEQTDRYVSAGGPFRVYSTSSWSSSPASSVDEMPEQFVEFNEAQISGLESSQQDSADEDLMDGTATDCRQIFMDGYNDNEGTDLEDGADDFGFARIPSLTYSATSTESFDDMISISRQPSSSYGGNGAASSLREGTETPATKKPKYVPAMVSKLRVENSRDVTRPIKPRHVIGLPRRLPTGGRAAPLGTVAHPPVISNIRASPPLISPEYQGQTSLPSLSSTQFTFRCKLPSTSQTTPIPRYPTPPSPKSTDSGPSTPPGEEFEEPAIFSSLPHLFNFQNPSLPTLPSTEFTFTCQLPSTHTASPFKNPGQGPSRPTLHLLSSPSRQPPPSSNRPVKPLPRSVAPAAPKIADMAWSQAFTGASTASMEDIVIPPDVSQFLDETFERLMVPQMSWGTRFGNSS